MESILTFVQHLCLSLSMQYGSLYKLNKHPKLKNVKTLQQTQMLNVWYIYLHLPQKLQYTQMYVYRPAPIEHLGKPTTPNNTCIGNCGNCGIPQFSCGSQLVSLKIVGKSTSFRGFKHCLGKGFSFVDRIHGTGIFTYMKTIKINQL